MEDKKVRIAMKLKRGYLLKMIVEREQKVKIKKSKKTFSTNRTKEELVKRIIWEDQRFKKIK